MTTKQDSTPDWAQAGDNTLHGAIDHWQGEAEKMKGDMQWWYQEAERRLDECNELRSELEGVQNLAIKQGEWLQNIVNITKGEPGELAQHSTHDVVESVQKALAQAKAAGAREALKLATQSPNFSDTVVRVDLMREIIEQMEKV